MQEKFVATLLSSLLIFCSNAAAEKRIISAGGSITEIIYALGAEDALVAVDTTSRYPSATHALPSIGYFRQLSAEGVLSFAPTDFLGLNKAGPDQVIKQLKGAGLNVKLFGEDKSRQGLYYLIEQLGNELDKPQQAKAIKSSLEEAFLALSDTQKALQKTQRSGLFILSGGERGLIVAGKNSVPDLLFKEAGLLNAASAITNYKVMDNEAIIAAKPDIIFVASHNFDAAQKEALCQHPAIRLVFAKQDCNLHVMASDLALAMTPRLPKAVEHIMSLAKP